MKLKEIYKNQLLQFTSHMLHKHKLPDSRDIKDEIAMEFLRFAIVIATEKPKNITSSMQMSKEWDHMDKIIEKIIVDNFKNIKFTLDDYGFRS